MKPERWQQINRLVQAALACEPGRRAAYLEQICAGDEGLRREIERRLGLSGEAETALDIVARPASGEAPSLLGQSLGPYRIESSLGAGGMGEVYLAHDTRLGRRVALKLLLPEFLADAERVQRFRREARAASALNHVNILTVYDIGEAGGVHYLATEYVEGQTLRQRMTVARLSIREAVEVTIQIAGALQAAHAAGVVHRDIKPENLMLRRDGYVKVLDFGIAKLVEQPGEEGGPGAGGSEREWMQTAEGLVLGTTSYMSPEQARGLEVDGRADIWSLGVVLYELVAGRRPFEGATPIQITIAVLKSEPTPLAECAPGVPAELERIVTKALAKDREARYQDAEGFLVDLRRLQQRVWSGADLEPTRGGSTRGTDERGAGATVERSRKATSEREATPNNLPQSLTRFIGRRQQVVEVRQKASGTRLTTLVGPGGIGKTRLALEVAREALAEYRDGVWLVELAALTDPALVAKAVASTLNAVEEPGRSLVETLTARLMPGRALLILDNCEHLLDACAQLCDALLRVCPDLRLLATSREPLGLSGEALWPVPGLSVPDAEGPLLVEHLFEYEATGLFLDRATLKNQGFAATERNWRPIVDLCRRLDGIPLAIELAAARVRVLTVEQILARMDDRFRLLTGGERSAPSRQQTLRAAIDWSHDLLAEEERIFLRRLSVFAGGWTLEAAEAVCSEPTAGEDPGAHETVERDAPVQDVSPVDRPDVFDLLARLVNKSFVVADEHGTDVRFRMLETLREYAAERLGADERERLRRRHAGLYLALAEESERQRGQAQIEWFSRLGAEQENLRAALEWSARQEEGETCLRLGGALVRFWMLRGQFSEGRAWLERGLALGAQVSPPVWAKALDAAGVLARWQGDYPRATELFEAALAELERAGDRRGVVKVLGHLAVVPYLRGDYAKARELWEQNLALERELGNTRGVAIALTCLGNVEAAIGGFDRAAAYYEESLLLHREVGDLANVARALGNLGVVALRRGEHSRAALLLTESLELNRELGGKHEAALALINLGDVARERGDLDEASARYGESLTMQQESANRWGLAYALEGLASVAALGGRAERALHLAGAARALRDAANMPLRPTEQTELDRYLEGSHRALGSPAAERALAEGGAMTVDRAIRYALAREDDR